MIRKVWSNVLRLIWSRSSAASSNIIGPIPVYAGNEVMNKH